MSDEKGQVVVKFVLPALTFWYCYMSVRADDCIGWSTHLRYPLWSARLVVNQLRRPSTFPRNAASTLDSTFVRTFGLLLVMVL